ncbi:sensor of ECF-type sigma factor [Flavobacterium ardleyense]|uniref:Sensor of ECF-type sigma factor n=1 Tax=Flavobacterium ardleyense TaxID=2038737 RepID=A0ABW5Z5N3_9FLAO
MIRKFILPILFLLVTTISLAQGHKEKQEKIKALKVAYITEQLELTADEAQKFWPIYNDLQEKQFDLRHEKMRAILNKLEAGSIEKLSDKEASSLLTQMENIEENLFALQKKYTKDLQGIMSDKKIMKLKKAEVDFNRHLLKQMREKHKN